MGKTSSALDAAITIDATGLSEQQLTFYNDDAPSSLGFDSNAVQSLQLAAAGNYHLDSGGGTIIGSFTVGQDGSVDYDPSLDQVVFSGLGTSTLVVVPHAIDVDATGLTQQQLVLFNGASYPFDSKTIQHLQLAAALGNSYHFNTGGGTVIGYFAVNTDGTIAYDPALDQSVFSGVGTTTIVVRPHAIDVDATGLTQQQVILFNGASYPFDSKTIQHLQLATAPAGSYGLDTPGGTAIGSFGVKSDGTIDYAPALDQSAFSGLGTTTIVILPHTINVDATGLTQQQLTLFNGASYPFDSKTIQHLQLAEASAASYWLDTPNGFAIGSFGVKSDGTADYDPSLDVNVFSGRGTSTIVIVPHAVSIDATGLSQQQLTLFNGAPSTFDSKTVLQLQLASATALSSYVVDSAGVEICSFTVKPNGTIDYDPAFNGVIGGRGTTTLTMGGGQQQPAPPDMAGGANDMGTACTCSGNDPGGGNGPGNAHTTADCGTDVCGSDGNTYSCSSAGWAFEASGCSHFGLTIIATDLFYYPTTSNITVSFRDMLGSPNDWIALAPYGSPDYTFSAYLYTDGAINGSLAFPPLPVGDYVARAYFANGFVKQAESGVFSVTCWVNSDCGGQTPYCDGGTCVSTQPTPQPVGAACLSGSDCSSTFCTYGVCCDTACTDSCGLCTFDTGGICSPVQKGSTGSNPSCVPLVCDGVSHSCPTTCADDSACVGNYHCTAGACVPNKDIAASCSQGDECLTGFCADGVCCTEACGPCGNCNTSSTPGYCVPRPAGATASDPSWVYVCDGSLRRPTTCKQASDCIEGASCSGGTCCPAGTSLCNGTCVPNDFCCGGDCPASPDGGTVLLTADHSSYASGAAITITFQNMLDTPPGWISLSASGSPNSSIVAWQYTNGLTTGSLTFSVPLPAGNYVARAYTNTKLAESSVFSVAQALNFPPTFVYLGCDDIVYSTADYVVCPLGATVYAGYKNMLGNPGDWLGVASIQASAGSFVARVSTGGATIAYPGTTPGPIPLPVLPPGTYVIEAFFGGSDTVQAVSDEFVVLDDGSPPSLTTDQTTYSPNSPIVVSFSGMLGTPTDWIAIAPQGAADTVESSRQTTGGATSGTLTFQSPTPYGTYVVRAFYANTAIKRSQSAPFTVPCVTAANCPSSAPYCDGVSCSATSPGALCSQDADCSSSHCANGVCCPTACGPCGDCSSGICVPLLDTPPSCFPYQCDGTSVSCPTTCQAQANCLAGFMCQSGVCIPIPPVGGTGCTSDSQCAAPTPYCFQTQCVALKGLGTSCNAGAECSSSFCSDGFCCDVACTGSCDACAKSLGAIANGSCSNVVGAGDPSCGAYKCNASSPACPTVCVVDSDCAAAYFCNAGSCATICNGSACSCGPSETYAASTAACLPSPQQCLTNSDCTTPDSANCEIAGGVLCVTETCRYQTSCSAEQDCVASVCAPKPPTVSSLAPSYAPNTTVFIKFSQLPGTPDDNVAIAPDGSDDSTLVASAITNGATSGVLTFAGLPSGNYRARAFSNSPAHIAESAVFVVGDPAVVPDEYLIVLTSDANVVTAADDLTQQYVLQSTVVMEGLNILGAVVPADHMAALLQDARVAFVDQDREGQLFQSTSANLCTPGAEPSGMIPQRASTGLRRVGGSVDGLHQTLTNKGQSVGVAILDTGIDSDHPDLAPNLAVGASVIEPPQPPILTPPDLNSTTTDSHGHGTAVAGIIAAVDNEFGVVGVAPRTTIYPVRVSETAHIKRASAVNGLAWVYQHNLTDPSHFISVVNMSWGMREPKSWPKKNSIPRPGQPDPCFNIEGDALHYAVCRLYRQGVTLVEASGNQINPGDPALIDDEASGTVDVPGYYAEVIVVSGITDSDGLPGGLAIPAMYPDCPPGMSPGAVTDDLVWTGSVTGPEVVIAAPAACIRTTRVGGDYCSFSETSAAAPFVSGAAALYIGSHPGATPAQVRAALRSTTDGSHLQHSNDESVLRLSAPVLFAGETSNGISFLSQIETDNNTLSRIMSLPEIPKWVFTSPGQDELAAVGIEQNITFVDLTTNSIKRVMPQPFDLVLSLNYSADGSKFYILGQNNCEMCQLTLNTFDAATGTLQVSLQLPGVEFGASHPIGLAAIAFHPDGKTFFLGDAWNTVPWYLIGVASTVGHYDLKTGERIDTFVGTSPDGYVNALALNKDGSVLYVGEGDSNQAIGRVDSFDTASGLTKGSMAIAQPETLTLSPDGSGVLATSPYWNIVDSLPADLTAVSISRPDAPVWSSAAIVNAVGVGYYMPSWDVSGLVWGLSHQFLVMQMTGGYGNFAIPDFRPSAIMHSQILAVGQKPLF